MNLYFDDWYQMETSSEKLRLVTRIYKYKFGMSEMETFDTCQTITVDNCINYSSFDTCSECDEEYFLTSTYQCQAYPKEKIQNCVTYSSATVCDECL